MRLWHPRIISLLGRDSNFCCGFLDLFRRWKKILQSKILKQPSWCLMIMDTARLGNEAMLFVTVFFITLFILGFLQVNHSVSLGLIVGIFPFVWGAGFAFEYELFHFLHKENLSKNQRRIAILSLSSGVTIQLICLFYFLGLYLRISTPYW